MKHPLRRLLTLSLLSSMLLSPAVASLAEEEQTPAPAPQATMQMAYLTDEERQIIEMMELLELLDMLQNLDVLTAMEDSK